ncbi:hypothetical protein [Burkholderia thailandensis]|uniref:hypothetical protein n=1 Tax=Burkholderia thailandensis TaxID=57975 RepID=UPI0012DB6229|nr:hypothetical protein [Burkholderia thailandensis]MCS6424492.1 hypothetical protein [Burkholderia thailandensis]MCS6451719.1 hypothetical protein [Burkholderia thailandensis]MCS6463806.1 hypothetical protein [Burkholderia thailandensis]
MRYSVRDGGDKKRAAHAVSDRRAGQAAGTQTAFVSRAFGVFRVCVRARDRRVCASSADVVAVAHRGGRHGVCMAHAVTADGCAARKLHSGARFVLNCRGG